MPSAAGLWRTGKKHRTKEHSRPIMMRPRHRSRAQERVQYELDNNETVAAVVVVVFVPHAMLHQDPRSGLDSICLSVWPGRGKSRPGWTNVVHISHKVECFKAIKELDAKWRDGLVRVVLPFCLAVP